MADCEPGAHPHVRRLCGARSRTRFTSVQIFLNGSGTSIASQSRVEETRELIHRITEDVRTIARDEVELVRDEVKRLAKTAAIEGAVITFGAIVGLIGFVLLCVAAVVALQPLIASLALRLVLMAIVYGAIGAVLAGTFGARLRRDIVPDVQVPVHEAKAVVQGAVATIRERGQQVHA